MYDTQLTPQEEQQFQTWVALQKGQGNIPQADDFRDYDMRGAWKKGLQGQYIPAHGEIHWSDEFKKPNHPTFSNQSIYATGDNAKYAGQWINPDQQGEQFIAPNVRYPQQDLLNYVQNLLYS